jgi:hypothetical protein
MPLHPLPRRRPGSLATTVSLLLLAPACGAPAGDDPVEVESLAQPLLASSGLSITGSSTLSLDPTFAQIFNGTFSLRNTTGKSVTLNKQLFFFAAPGGYAFTQPSFDVWWPSPLSSSSNPLTAGPFGWGWSAPVAHLVVRVDGTTSAGTKVAGLSSIAVLAPGKAAPAASPYVDDVDIGVIAPLELLTLSSGERWLPVTGSIVDTTNTATAAPALTGTARNSSGTTVATLGTTFTVPGPQDLPIRHFVSWATIPAGKTVAKVKLTASQSIAGGTGQQTREIAVVNAAPFAVASPVAGTWLWGNGPGDTGWNAHTGSPEGRYAYDLGIHQLVNGNLQSYDGDPNQNTSFFCWGKPIRAAFGGTVVHVEHSHPDNNGFLFDHDEGNNEIIIQHPNGLYTRYAHMRQGSAVVAVGQVVAAGTKIAEVGNAGSSSEPHLHFHAFRVDNTGRVAAVPTVINGLTSLNGVGLAGIPKGGLRYQTP